ncbi:hypothetical protein K493DRAFT_77807 [Basidiobolus meristosporus CBS 931.73]|uniref:K Homology domain-containing protein n=1 Tax=Basidiobolus meristosporus CBS 931.73 TaxID=1314790 RepID=A0A1Y1XRV2_9FUNG|nr:hypothetical protein K493DRAFT_77807 [Basidiobolus meristosporus CBS 931.73]|eukprot:ORX88492.1 hypothetical protein K493DRAFT_77807 [Basidiobolus meristosporus CBS 931.73]
MSEDYNAVPPPSALSGGGNSGVNFSDALAKAKAIAAKLSADSSKKDSDHGSANKRGYDEDHEQYGYNRGGDYDGGEYRRDYGDYGHDSKRQAYDRADNSRPRYGLGSEERRGGSSYGPSGGTESIEFSIPSSVVGLVIGRGGESLKRIERAQGVKVQFSQDHAPSDPERKVTIIGLPDDVEKAKDMILQTIEESRANRAAGGGGGYGSRHSAGPGQSTVYINVPNNKVGLVIGKGGETIRMLQERSGARITVTPDSARDPSSHDRPVSVIGDELAIERARALIEEVISGDPYRGRGQGFGGPYGAGGYGGNYENVTIQVPNDTVGLLIGKGGETIKMLQQQSGAKIQIEQVTGGAPGPERNIFISGSPDSVGYAKQLIYERTSGNRKGGRHGDKSDDYSQSYTQDPYSSSSQAGYNYGYYDYQNYGQAAGGYGYYPGQQAGAGAGAEGQDGAAAAQYPGYPAYDQSGYTGATAERSGQEGEENAENGASAAPSQEYDQSQYANYYAQYGQYADAYQQYYAQYYQQQGYAYPQGEEGAQPEGTQEAPTDAADAGASNEAEPEERDSEQPAEEKSN